MPIDIQIPNRKYKRNTTPPKKKEVLNVGTAVENIKPTTKESVEQISHKTIPMPTNLQQSSTEGESKIKGKKKKKRSMFMLERKGWWWWWWWKSHFRQNNI